MIWNLSPCRSRLRRINVFINSPKWSKRIAPRVALKRVKQPQIRLRRWERVNGLKNFLRLQFFCCFLRLLFGEISAEDFYWGTEGKFRFWEPRETYGNTQSSFLKWAGNFPARTRFFSQCTQNNSSKGCRNDAESERSNSMFLAVLCEDFTSKKEESPHRSELIFATIFWVFISNVLREFT